ETGARAEFRIEGAFAAGNCRGRAGPGIVSWAGALRPGAHERCLHSVCAVAAQRPGWAGRSARASGPGPGLRTGRGRGPGFAPVHALPGFAGAYLGPCAGSAGDLPAAGRELLYTPGARARTSLCAVAAIWQRRDTLRLAGG